MPAGQSCPPQPSCRSSWSRSGLEVGKKPSNEIDVVTAGLGICSGIRVVEMEKTSFSGDGDREADILRIPRGEGIVMVRSALSPGFGHVHCASCRVGKCKRCQTLEIIIISKIRGIFPMAGTECIENCICGCGCSCISRLLVAVDMGKKHRSKDCGWTR